MTPKPGSVWKSKWDNEIVRVITDCQLTGHPRLTKDGAEHVVYLPEGSRYPLCRPLKTWFDNYEE